MALRAVRAAVMSCAVLIGSPICADAGGPAATDAEPKSEADTFKLEFGSLVASDYVYRGVSLSARRPTAAASIELEWHKFYTGANVQSVKLPTSPAAEITLSGGYRWTIADFEFDLGANYFYYPGEIPTDTTTSTSYWEYALNVDRDLTERISVNGQLAYAPNVSNTGAWGAYAEGAVTIELPPLDLLRNINWELAASIGHWRFGNTSPEQGGFALPAYTNWHVGLGFNSN
jgi:uncharacterized protein (TIGR02001 family)